MFIIPALAGRVAFLLRLFSLALAFPGRQFSLGKFWLQGLKNPLKMPMIRHDPVLPDHERNRLPVLTSREPLFFRHTTPSAMLSSATHCDTEVRKRNGKATNQSGEGQRP